MAGVVCVGIVLQGSSSSLELPSLECFLEMLHPISVEVDCSVVHPEGSCTWTIGVSISLNNVSSVSRTTEGSCLEMESNNGFSIVSSVSQIMEGQCSQSMSNMKRSPIVLTIQLQLEQKHA